jgi:hypothetical protein
MKFVLIPGKSGLILLLAVSLFSCHGIPRRYIIPQKKFVNLLVDIHLADGIGDENQRFGFKFTLDSAALYRSVFSKHGFTRAQFDSTMSYYTSHPDEFQEVYNELTARLKRMEDDIKAETEKVEGKKEEGGSKE